MSAGDLDSRITRLEEGMFFQERLLRDLNTALTDQQAQLDVMERLLHALQEKVGEISESGQAGGGPVNTKPPHYSG